jgi:hypothetical protein
LNGTGGSTGEVGADADADADGAPGLKNPPVGLPGELGSEDGAASVVVGATCGWRGAV